MSQWKYLDAATQAPDLFLPIGAVSVAETKLQSAFGPAVAPFQDLECEHPPTECKESDNFYRSMDSETAAQLKVTYIGTGNADVDHKMKVFIREFRRYSDCELANGQGTVRYGAVWRASVLIDEADAKADVSFPMVAASATLRNHSVQVHISSAGFDKDDQVGIDDAGQKAMAATKGGLNVTNFSQFADLLDGAIGLAIKANVATPLSRIGFEPRYAPELGESVARAFAIACAAEGRSEDNALKGFPLRNKSIEKAVRDVYAKLQENDKDPRIVRIKAQSLIEGVQIPIRQWYQFWK
jgi:hypothetical protein